MKRISKLSNYTGTGGFTEAQAKEKVGRYVRDLDSDVKRIYTAFGTTLSINSLVVGDDTNNVSISSDGSIALNGTATQWDDLRIEPIIRGTGANNPAFAQWFTDGAGSRGVYLYNFTDETTANQREIFYTVQMPHSWAATPVYMHVHWIPSANGTTQRPVWGLEYTWADIGSVFGNSSIVYTTSLAPSEANLVQYKHYISAFDAITPSTSQDGLSTILIIRLFRRSGDASDTFTGTCGLLYADLHFEIDSFGSKEEYVK